MRKNMKEISRREEVESRVRDEDCNNQRRELKEDKSKNIDD